MARTFRGLVGRENPSSSLRRDGRLARALFCSQKPAGRVELILRCVRAEAESDARLRACRQQGEGEGKGGLMKAAARREREGEAKR